MFENETNSKLISCDKQTEAMNNLVVVFSVSVPNKYRNIEKTSRGVVENVLDYDIVESEFEPQQRICVHLRTNTLGRIIVQQG